jgi:hypothetical protein
MITVLSAATDFHDQLFRRKTIIKVLSMKQIIHIKGHAPTSFFNYKPKLVASDRKTHVLLLILLDNQKLESVYARLFRNPEK